VRNFFSSVDVSALTTYTAVDLGFAADGVTLVNNSGLAVEVSFDGSTKAGELSATGLEQAMEWYTSRADRAGASPRAVYLKRKTGTGGSAVYVNVYAEAFS
jgi:hypothetical protein